MAVSDYTKDSDLARTILGLSTRLSALERGASIPATSARVFNSTNISTTSGALTALTFDTVRWDDRGLHVAAGKLAANTGGLHVIGANVRFAANATGYRLMQLRVNGTTVIAFDARLSAGATAETDIQLSTMWQLSAGDYVEVLAAQGSGGSLNIEVAGDYSPEFWLARYSG